MRLFLLIFLTSFTAIFGQKLKFDVMAKYSVTSNNSTYERSAYIISSNDNYIMQVKNYDEQQVAQVYDLKSLKMHKFKITESKSENDVIKYNFTYSNTTTFVRSPVKKNYFEFQSISIEGNTEIVNLIFYKNKSKTKAVNVLKLKILKSEVNFFPLFRFTCLHPSEFISELTYVNGGLVTESISENGLSKSILNAFEEASLELTIPN